MIFLSFLISCTRTHLRMAELGCLAPTPIFSSTIPLACETHRRGSPSWPRRCARASSPCPPSGCGGAGAQAYELRSDRWSSSS
ncbi:40S ribosomal protein S23, putative [Leishmania tarentolae]|uniref:40S ribosomal protein S23, putative n=1 Tax=Leishmania tarentolae TaxID=5689 RepID=A0A640KH26_LEITA|nr:40S ribosomal protein S23, putative [Leishmania tarentolae]GET88364.1 40S ribosomal protein S23, putative [Leishmania tarentolae]